MQNRKASLVAREYLTIRKHLKTDNTHKDLDDQKWKTELEISKEVQKKSFGQGEGGMTVSDKDPRDG